MRRRPWISHVVATGRSWDRGHAILHLLCGLLLFGSAAPGLTAGQGGFGGFRPTESPAGGYVASGTFPGSAGESYGAAARQSYSGAFPPPQYGVPPTPNPFPAADYEPAWPAYGNGPVVPGYGAGGSGHWYDQGYGAPVQGYGASSPEYAPTTPGFWVPMPDYGKQDQNNRDAAPRFGAALPGYDRPPQGYRFREQPDAAVNEPAFPRFRPSPMGMDSPYRWGRDEGALGPAPVYRPLEGALPGGAAGGQSYPASPRSYTTPSYRPGNRRSDPRFRPLKQ